MFNKFCVILLKSSFKYSFEYLVQRTERMPRSVNVKYVIIEEIRMARRLCQVILTLWLIHAAYMLYHLCIHTTKCVTAYNTVLWYACRILKLSKRVDIITPVYSYTIKRKIYLHFWYCIRNIFLKMKNLLNTHGTVLEILS